MPGDPGDNYSFLWNLWWMRHVIATPGLPYFHTTYLFHPFGTTIANHPHTALPALVAATLLGPASIVTAQNLLLLAYVFANMAAMYALAWDIARHRRAAILGGVIFGLSPYLAAHLLGHFDLMAAWVLPLFALCVRRAMRAGSRGVDDRRPDSCSIATAYTTYYYVVYLCFFLAVYSIASLDWRPVRWAPRAPSPAARRLRYALSVLMAMLAAARGVDRAERRANALVLVTSRCRCTASKRPDRRLDLRVVFALSLLAAGADTRAVAARGPPYRDGRRPAWPACSSIGAAPLLWQALQLIVRGEYVTPGVRMAQRAARRRSAGAAARPPAAPADGGGEPAGVCGARPECRRGVGWLGIVPIVLLVVTPARASSAASTPRPRSGGSSRSRLRSSRSVRF